MGEGKGETKCASGKIVSMVQVIIRQNKYACMPHSSSTPNISFGREPGFHPISGDEICNTHLPKIERINPSMCIPLASTSGAEGPRSRDRVKRDIAIQDVRSTCIVA